MAEDVEAAEWEAHQVEAYAEPVFILKTAAERAEAVAETSADGASPAPEFGVALDAADGEAVTIQLLDHGLVAGQVRWSRDGRIGIHFTTPIDEQGRD